MSYREEAMALVDEAMTTLVAVLRLEQDTTGRDSLVIEPTFTHKSTGKEINYKITIEEIV